MKHIILLQKDRKGKLIFGMQYDKSVSVGEVCNITQHFLCGKLLRYADITRLLSCSAIIIQYYFSNKHKIFLAECNFKWASSYCVR